MADSLRKHGSLRNLPATAVLLVDQREANERIDKLRHSTRIEIQEQRVVATDSHSYYLCITTQRAPKSQEEEMNSFR